LARLKDRIKKQDAGQKIVIGGLVLSIAREKAKQKEQDRKDDTRRKILLGSMLLKDMENEEKKTKILADLNEYLTEDRDRKLFGL